MPAGSWSGRGKPLLWLQQHVVLGGVQEGGSGESSAFHTLRAISHPSWRSWAWGSLPTAPLGPALGRALLRALAVPRGGMGSCSQQHTLPGAWMDATSCTLGQAQLLWLVQQYSCAHAGLCQGAARLAPVLWRAGRGDQRGLARLYLCPEECRPTHSQRSSTCVPQGSPGHWCSGWGRQQLSSGHASGGRTQLWLEGRLRVWYAASLAPLLTTPLQFSGGCRPLRLPQGILSLARGSPGHLTWLSKHAAGAAATGAALLP